ncbi:hypothetical protein JX266_002473 [Neoarthrinium moseri]|nr:hypothetical protein JX266_002473 [Neoarthrinium moseri]
MTPDVYYLVPIRFVIKVQEVLELLQKTWTRSRDEFADLYDTWNQDRLQAEKFAETVEKMIGEWLAWLAEKPLLSIVWTAILRAFLFLLGEGTRSRRPRHITCATMPWAIRPSLVVLWGVCWMFYDSSQSASPSFNLEGPIDLAGHGNEIYFDPYTGFNFDLNELVNSYDDFPSLVEATHPTSTSGISINAGVLDSISQPIGPIYQERGGSTQQTSTSTSSNQAVALDDSSIATATSLPSKQPKAFCCPEPDCDVEFGTERELQRHRESIHNGSKFPCMVTGCKRGPRNPCNRKDNLQRHMRKVHGQGIGESPAITVEIPARGRKRQAGSSTQGSSFSPDGKRQQTRETMSTEVADLQRQLADVAAQRDALAEKNKALVEEKKVLMEENRIQHELLQVQRKRITDLGKAKASDDG